MKLKTALLATALTFTALPALAHDDESYGHGAFHGELGEAHERAHEEGFESHAEHRAYHRALRNLHEAYHEDRDGYAGYYSYRSRYYYSQPRYRSSGWYYGW
ncbi:hypothetical protein [Bradyrhizobium sp. Leo121]|uniref:hypothetical protein n=1 Tax=Bradyrhizobium sp. Leo121 TaxID=1571195 RepID=UPI001028E3C8|nr:hypothetical protein [Bradyrhizobium sp. Leo121]